MAEGPTKIEVWFISATVLNDLVREELGIPDWEFEIETETSTDDLRLFHNIIKTERPKVLITMARSGKPSARDMLLYLVRLGHLPEGTYLVQVW